ncbi:MAG: DUF4406 domain-containing protein [Firmicutes bacterium]|nr:DUF4406 domain-containing protein [Bacillota bacterium]
MTKIMLSNGLRGKSYPAKYVKQCDQALENWAKVNNVQYELLHSFRPNQYEKEVAEHGLKVARIRMLGETITDELAMCDILALCDDWYNYDGCQVEFEIAKRYGKPIVFLPACRTGRQTADFNSTAEELQP